MASAMPSIATKPSIVLCIMGGFAVFLLVASAPELW
jgi:hypothetical protein